MKFFGLFLLATGLSGGVAGAVNFSVALTPSATFAPPDDILVPGPFPIYGGGASGFDVNGFSYGHPVGLGVASVSFSVDAGAAGLAGSAVSFEGAAPGEQSAGIYTSPFSGTNTHLHDGDGAVFGVPAAGPPLGLIESTFPGPGLGPFDDVDGLDLRTAGAPPGGPIFWTPDFATGGPGAADAIFISPAGPGYPAAGAIWAGPVALGLAAGDDIDALVVFEDGTPGFSIGDFVWISLAPGSPTLGGIGAGPGDIIGIGFAGVPGVIHPGGAYGILPGDNLNALDVTLIPEPGSAVMLALAGLAFARRRRRRSA